LSYVETHGHADHSILDASFIVEDRVKRAIELGMPAVALTDHGNMHGAIDFYRAAKKHGIKPIMGCEVYCARQSAKEPMNKHTGNPSDHLVLLARDNEGYENLMRIVSAGYEYFHYTPRVDLEILAAHSKGIIAQSACLSGGLARQMTGWETWNPKTRQVEQIDPDFEGAVQLAMNLSDIFGPNGFFPEIQGHRGQHQDNELVRRQEIVEAGMYELMKRTGLPGVITNDSHFKVPEDGACREIAFLIARGGTMDKNKFDGVSHSAEFYMKSYQEMLAAFPGRDPSLFTNTLWIAEQCNVEIDLDSYHFVKPIDEHGEMTPERVEAIWNQKLNQGFLNRYGHAENKDEAWQRLLYEKGVIEQMGFVPYFLVTEDFVSWARTQGIPVGPGRGSAGGCIISYCLGITNLDPLAYGLMFERFLNPERVSMPDIDIDFCKDRVPEVLEYVTNKYGAERVARISAFGHMWAKQVFRDVGRVLDVDQWKISRICDSLPDAQGNFRMSVKDAIELVPEVQELSESPLEKDQKLLKIAQGLEGIRRLVTSHACGVVIGDQDLRKYCALMPVKEDDFGGMMQSQLDMNSLEALGLLKMDFLALDTLTILSRVSGLDLEAECIPRDPKIYEMIQSGRTVGAFQIESGGMRELCMRVKPADIEDLSAILALYRPGPMDFRDDAGLSMVDHYILRKQGREEITYPHPSIEWVLKPTLGIMVYQEQIMQISQALCGFTGPEADTLRKGVGKKLPELVAKAKSDLRFIERAQEFSGCSVETAESIWHTIETFARYGFNKSHSTAYALITYQTMWAKVYKPVEFMASCLSSAAGYTPPELRDFVKKKTRSELKLRRYIDEAGRLGIRVMDTDVNLSNDPFSVEDGAIRVGLCSVKGVATNAAKVVLARKLAGGKFKDYVHMVHHCVGVKLTKRTLEALIKSGACDGLGERNQMLVSLPDTLKTQRKAVKDQGDVVSMMAPPEELPDIHPMSEDQRRALALEHLGAYSVDLSSLVKRVGIVVQNIPTAEKVIDILRRHPGDIEAIISLRHKEHDVFLSAGTFSSSTEALDELRQLVVIKEV